MKFHHLIPVLLSLLLGNITMAQSDLNENVKPFTIGETVKIQSSILNEDRVLNIYLPHSYSKDSARVFPVIYLLDGSIDEDIIHISGLVQFASFSWINLIPETIVVGISNVDRKRDFTFPTTIKKDKEDFPTTGESAKFIHFLEEELITYVESNYKTNSSKTLIGQSLGGLLATEILIRKPELFDNYIIVSPSIWWDNESIMKLEPKGFNTQKSIFIAVGKEGEVMERTAKELYQKMIALENDKANLYFEYFEKQDHADVLHLAVYRAFEVMTSLVNESSN